MNTLAKLGEHRASFASFSEPALGAIAAVGRAFLRMLFVFAEFVRA